MEIGAPEEKKKRRARGPGKKKLIAAAALLSNAAGGGGEEEEEAAAAAAAPPPKKQQRTTTGRVKKERTGGTGTEGTVKAVPAVPGGGDGVDMVPVRPMWAAFPCDGPRNVAPKKPEQAAAAAAKTTAVKPVLRLAQMSTAEFSANVGSILASSVPESEKVARILEARDYRGIHLFADPATGDVYNPDDIMAKVINPRVLDPETMAQLGPWVRSTGLGNAGGGGGGGGDDDDDDDDE